MKNIQLLQINLLKLFFFLSLIFLSSCQTNPATGEEEFLLMSEKEEYTLGAKEHKQIIKEFGGVYSDKKINNYVISLGEFLLATSELAGSKFTFTVLDTQIANAFALPGGFVYVTRGLISLCQNEAQLAGVIAHEIGHISARHTARRYTRNISTSVLVNILGTLTNNIPLQNIINQSAGLYSLSYSRKHEYEADLLAIKYMKRAGFNVTEMVNFLSIMEEYSSLSKRIANIKKGSIPELLSTHPSSSNRVKKLIEQNKKFETTNPITGREIFLKRIEGMIYGSNLKEGVIYNQKFIHPILKISFNIPESFYFLNYPKNLIGYDSQGARIIFDMDMNKNKLSIKQYARNWKKLPKNSSVNYSIINNFKTSEIIFTKGKEKINLFLLQDSDSKIYRFIFISKFEEYKTTYQYFQNIVKSFKFITKSEASRIKPNTISIKTKEFLEKNKEKNFGQSIQKKFSRDIFRTLNGLNQKKDNNIEKFKIIENKSF